MFPPTVLDIPELFAPPLVLPIDQCRRPLEGLIDLLPGAILAPGHRHLLEVVCMAPHGFIQLALVAEGSRVIRSSFAQSRISGVHCALSPLG